MSRSLEDVAPLLFELLERGLSRVSDLLHAETRPLAQLERRAAVAVAPLFLVLCVVQIESRLAVSSPGQFHDDLVLLLLEFFVMALKKLVASFAGGCCGDEVPVALEFPTGSARIVFVHEQRVEVCERTTRARGEREAREARRAQAVPHGERRVEQHASESPRVGVGARRGGSRRLGQRLVALHRWCWRTRGGLELEHAAQRASAGVPARAGRAYAIAERNQNGLF